MGHTVRTADLQQAITARHTAHTNALFSELPFCASAALQCGTGLTTAKIGSVSVDACLVPAGWGLTQLTPEPIPVMCANGSYGVNSTRAVVATSRCVLCPPNMFTADQLTNVTAAQGYMDEQACLVRPGWGTTATGVEICPAGSYNEGLNRKVSRVWGWPVFTLAQWLWLHLITNGSRAQQEECVSACTCAMYPTFDPITNHCYLCFQPAAMPAL
jgi:hypothetical protein